MKSNIFREINGVSGYSISFEGVVLNDKRQLELKTFKTKGGYTRVSIKSKKYLVHRLVAIAFLDNPENKSEVNHKDGNKDNNHYSNLEWVTASENIQHGHRIGLNNQKGSKNNSSKLTEFQVIEIRKRYAGGDNLTSIAKTFNTKVSNIFYIVNRKTWKHI